jgi:hypothetical protein
MHSFYSGNSAYCFSNSLRMCLHAAGIADLPEVGQIECMTGMPFGATFLQFEEPLFFPDATDPDEGLTRAIATLGWACETWRGEDATPARAALLAAIGEGPVLLGPLDMGYLPYDPGHQNKRGGDHYIVALRREDDLVQVHDPQLYPFAVLPLADLMRSWRATHLGYAKSAYTLRYRFRQERSVPRQDMLAATLATARADICRAPAGPAIYGPRAFALAAEVIDAGPRPELAGMLSYFVLALGARRSLDAAAFFEAAGEGEAAQLTQRKAELFGRAQLYAARKEWAQVAELFRRMEALEAQLTAPWL